MQHTDTVSLVIVEICLNGTEAQTTFALRLTRGGRNENRSFRAIVQGGMQDEASQRAYLHD
jgi:hypothetical protein